MNKHSIIIGLKKFIYKHGESYKFNSSKLNFLPGSRPIKRKYINSQSDVVRNDVLQIEFFEKYFKQTDTLWDIGSHHGHYSIFAASMANGDDQVFSFEPDKDAMNIQKQNIALNNLGTKIRTFDVAVSNKTGVLYFNALGGNSNSHIVKDNGKDLVNVISVPTKTIDALLDEIPSPTFVKIDTEGAEIDILKSASKLLMNKNVTFICELHPFAWKNFDVKYEEFQKIISEADRQITLLDKSKMISELPYYGTVLF